MRAKIIFLVFVLSVVWLSLVAARLVYQWDIYFEDYAVWPANENPCGYDIEWTWIGTYRAIGWWDKEGQILRAFENYSNIKGTYSANGRSVKEVSGRTHLTVLPDNTIQFTTLGTSSFITIPGYGQVWGRAGQISEIYQRDPTSDTWILIETIRDVGKISYDDFSPVCEYLAP